jgi:hypothetical protein
MFDMLQPGDHAEDFDDLEDFEAFEESARLAEIIQLTQQAAPATPRNPRQFATELDAVPPGVHLAAMVDQLNLDTITGHEQVAVLRAQQRQASHHQAMVYRAIAAIVTTMEDEFDDPESQIHAATAEIRAALRLTRRAAETELHMALELVRRVPAIIDALEAGLIDNRRARAIVHGTTHLDDDTAQHVVDAIIDDAPRFTTGQLIAQIRKLCIDTDPDQATKRYNHAVEQRAIRAQATEAGTVGLYATDLAPDRAAAVMAHLNHTARTLRNQGDPRSMDQLRADVFIDLLDGTHTRCGGTRGGVNLTADLETLTRLTEHPGELAGYGPVIADIARQVTQHQHHSQWTYTITDPPHRNADRRRHHPTPPHREATPLRPSQRPGLCVPRMPHARRRLRPRPHRTPLPRRPHLRQQPRTRLPPRPHHPHQTRLDLPQTPQQRLPMDHQTRLEPHHQRQTTLTAAGPRPIRRIDPHHRPGST